MSSYRKLDRRFRPGKKRSNFRWIAKLCLWFCLAAIIWWGISYCYNTVLEWRKPRYITVESQKEAMDKLERLLAPCMAADAELIAAAQEWEKRTEWMKSEEARVSVAWIFVEELAQRQLWPQHDQLWTALVLRDLEKSGEMTEAEREKARQRLFVCADAMKDRKTYKQALMLYQKVLDLCSNKEELLSIRAIESIVEIKMAENASEDVLNAIDLLRKKVDLPALKDQGAIRAVARMFLLQDRLSQNTPTYALQQGRKLAEALLKKTSMTSCPEWGMLLLFQVRDQLKTEKPQNVDQLRQMLEQALVCFRGADAEELSYIPEIMLALAQLHLDRDQVELSTMWTDRAEGVAMALGVDRPKVLGNTGLREDIGTLRTKYQNLRKEQEQMVLIDRAIEVGAKRLKASQWEAALAEAREALVLAGKRGSFKDGYIPVAMMQVASAFEGQKKWEEASSVYNDILKQWDKLEQKERSETQTMLDRRGYSDFEKLVVSRLAYVYRKRDMITRAKELLKQRLGEGSSQE